MKNFDEIRVITEIATHGHEPSLGDDLTASDVVQLFAFSVVNFVDVSAKFGTDFAIELLRSFVRPAGIGLWEAVVNEDLALRERLGVFPQIALLYSSVFDPLCEPLLVHRSETRSAFNLCCYMWWEEFPSLTYLPSGERLEISLASKRTLYDIVRSNQNIACHESVAHAFLDHGREIGLHHLDILPSMQVHPAFERLRPYLSQTQSN